MYVVCGVTCNMRCAVRPYPVQAAFESIFDKNAAVLDLPLELFDEDRVEPTTPGSTRTELPVFMLDVSACPGGVVPLHIFEMRYRQVRLMVWDTAHSTDGLLTQRVLCTCTCRCVASLIFRRNVFDCTNTRSLYQCVFLFWTFALFSTAPVGLFSRSRLRGTQGPACTPRRKFGSRAGSVARALGFQSRESGN